MFLIVFYLLLSPLAIGGSEQPPIDSTDNAEKPLLIRQITFEGLEHLNRKQLTKLIGIDAGKPYLPTDMVAGLNRVLEKYREDGFVFVAIEPEVETTAPDQVHIHLHVYEGNRLAQAKLQLKGITCFPPMTSVVRSVCEKGHLSATLPLRVGLTRS